MKWAGGVKSTPARGPNLVEGDWDMSSLPVPRSPVKTDPPALSVVPAARGFPGLPCLRCGETDTTTVNLGDVLTFACTNCERETTAAEVEAHLAAWRAVLDWCAKAPAVQG
jgi:hypothetical protein